MMFSQWWQPLAINASSSRQATVGDDERATSIIL